jgi:CRP-like cAMP-binding protein
MDWGFLGGLPEEERRAVHSRMVRRRYRRREIVFHEGDLGDRLYLVAKGRLLARVLTSDGDESALALHGVGDVLGEMIILSGNDRRSATVVALEAAELMSLSAADVMELRREFPSVDTALDQIVAERNRALLQLLQEARYLPADKRVLRRIISLEPYFDAGPTGQVEIRITQEDLAAMAGTTRPTANRALQRAEAAGAISIARRRLTIADPELLARLAK